MEINENVLNEMIRNQIEENLHLDYKAADALGKSDGKKKEISKDISAMANSDGGRIIYGIKEFDDKERNHLPEKITPIDRNEFSKEWIEQVINSNISPRINGVKIFSVQLSTNQNNVVYVIDIPKSETAHQASDLRYYKRFNFVSVPMNDYEIRDIMNRGTYPKIDLEFEVQVYTYEPYNPLTPPTFDPLSRRSPIKKTKTSYTLHIYARNNGRHFANYVNAFIEVPASIIEEEDLKGYNYIGNDYIGHPCKF
ncbi:AlbA family DNA-binding domain-containing protein [Flavilitoribacter nigricans]|uniref:Schlafen AlbA-2 domain-containing protein n=1 Tax=Flavilitoribacter nigricans (strain ATCC 23147 / DSM 23189 / NBRC 102662 / NCIMB 1420 / SS-2) TaxID=1122177 RepID=A0A2D0NCP0_FLAN2|nr:ATP-binding protein [Flavilitoribacter nigricans]PHN06140.1 hypothetical protein CRP01_11185 [Flavilitoribacter nigricans DSM 23189 = NBRC 102662]